MNKNTTEPVKINPFEQGPHLQAAVFCEQVIEGKDGVLSLIRVIDTLVHTAQGPDAPLEMPPVDHKMKLVIMLKSGRAKGRHELRIVPRLPNGQALPPAAMSVHLEGEDRGANVIMDFGFRFQMEGLYWFEVWFNEELLTRMPFRVRYMRVATGASPAIRTP